MTEYSLKQNHFFFQLAMTAANAKTNSTTTTVVTTAVVGPGTERIILVVIV